MLRESSEPERFVFENDGFTAITKLAHPPAMQANPGHIYHMDWIDYESLIEDPRVEDLPPAERIQHARRAVFAATNGSYSGLLLECRNAEVQEAVVDILRSRQVHVLTPPKDNDPALQFLGVPEALAPTPSEAYDLHRRISDGISHYFGRGTIFTGRYVGPLDQDVLSAMRQAADRSTPPR